MIIVWFVDYRTASERTDKCETLRMKSVSQQVTILIHHKNIIRENIIEYIRNGGDDVLNTVVHN